MCTGACNPKRNADIHKNTATFVLWNVWEEVKFSWFPMPSWSQNSGPRTHFQFFSFYLCPALSFFETKFQCPGIVREKEKTNPFVWPLLTFSCGSSDFEAYAGDMTTWGVEKAKRINIALPAIIPPGNNVLLLMTKPYFPACRCQKTGEKIICKKLIESLCCFHYPNNSETESERQEAVKVIGRARVNWVWMS